MQSARLLSAFTALMSDPKAGERTSMQPPGYVHDISLSFFATQTALYAQTASARMPSDVLFNSTGVSCPDFLCNHSTYTKNHVWILG